MGRAPLFTLFCSLVILSILTLSKGADILTVEGSISDGETLISSSQSFELGFFAPRQSKNKYFGIWFKNSPGTVVWVANRNTPIIDGNGVLTVSDSGNLVLLNQTKNVIWSSNVSRHERTGQERYLTSWKSADDPSPRNLTYRLDINGLPQLAIERGSMKIFRTGPWNGIGFGAVPAVANLVFKPIVVSNENESYFTYEPVSNVITMRLWLNQSGSLQHLILNPGSSKWGVLYSVPFDQCDSYGLCGANSICSSKTTDTCECLTGFIPKSQEERGTTKSLSMNCVRELPLDC